MPRWMRFRFRRFFGRFSRNENGAAAVEFALVAWPFLFVLGCVCETGLMLFVEYVLQNSVQDAARLVRTGQTSASDGTITMASGDFKTALCTTVSVVINCSGNVSIYVNNAADFTTLTSTISDPLTIGPTASGGAYTTVYAPGARNRAAAVIATYDWVFTFPFMSYLSNFGTSGTTRRLYGIAIFRNEPF